VTFFLSTPSLGSQDLFYLHRAAYNSLADFQLPLSGSQAHDWVDYTEEDFRLSTPSFGITETTAPEDA
jgi:hypothetical protein